MLRQEQLPFIKATTTLQHSPALLKELKLAMFRRKKLAMHAGSRNITSGSGARASQQLAGKHKANLLASSGDYVARQQAPSTWRWVPASARDFISHGRTKCCRQPETRAIRGRGDVGGSAVQSRCPASAKWIAQSHSHGFGLI